MNKYCGIRGWGGCDCNSKKKTVSIHSHPPPLYAALETKQNHTSNLCLTLHSALRSTSSAFSLSQANMQSWNMFFFLHYVHYPARFEPYQCHRGVLEPIPVHVAQWEYTMDKSHTPSTLILIYRWKCRVSNQAKHVIELEENPHRHPQALIETPL